MTMAEAEGSCPACGASMTFTIDRSDDAPPEAMQALRLGIADYAAHQERVRRIRADLRRLRFVFYLAAGACTGSGLVYMNGNDMMSKWYAVAASATAALAWFAAATWVIDLKERTIR